MLNEKEIVLLEKMLDAERRFWNTMVNDKVEIHSIRAVEIRGIVGNEAAWKEAAKQLVKSGVAEMVGKKHIQLILER